MQLHQLQGRAFAQARQCPHRVVVGRPATRTVVRVAADEGMEEIDPITGLVINKLAPTAPVAGNSVKVGSLDMSYRASTVEKAAPGLPKVLLVHGLGSSSFSWRNSLGLLGGDGVTAYAPDMIGHGDSSKPSPSGAFDYSEEAYVRSIGQFADAVGMTEPFALIVQGYITSQYALQYALEHPGRIERLMILNTPLSRKAALRPELAAYKAPLPFMRPGKNAKFDGMMFSATGSPYAMQRRDAEVYGKPYVDDPAASVALATTMDKVDFPKLCARVDDGFMSWRKPSMLLFGSDDPFIDLGTAFEFLDSKRTNMKISTVPARLGHMPQEDFPEAIHEVIAKWLRGETDTWSIRSTTDMRMTKKGAVNN